MTIERPRYLWAILLFVFGAIALVVLYSPTLHEPYFGDDYQWVFLDPIAMLGRAFTSVVGPDNHWYRPLQAFTLAAIQSSVGLNTWPIHLLLLTSHAVFAWLIYRLMRTLPVTHSSAIIATVYFAISQIAAIVLVGNDMLSQLWSGLFGFLTIVLLARAQWFRQSEKARLFYACSLLSFVLALLSKESSSTLILGTGLVVAFTAPRRDLWGIMRAVLVKCWPYAVILVLFLAWRRHLGAIQPNLGGEGMYDFRFGSNVVKNAALFLAQSVLPVSSFSTMRALSERNIIALALAGTLAGAFCVAVIWGLVRSGKAKLIVASLLLMVIGVTPSIFLNHVSESYLYNSLPWLAVLIGLAANSYSRGTTIWMKAFAATVGVIVLVTNGWADYSKAQAIESQAERAATLLPQVIEAVRAAPSGANVYLVHPKVQEFEYSVFRYRGFRVLEWTEPFVANAAHQGDISIRQVDRPTLDSFRTQNDAAYTYDSDWRLIPVR